MSLRVAAFYRFAPLAEAALLELRQRLLAVGSAGKVKGTVLLAPEGVNGTVSGPEAGVEALLGLLQGADSGLASLEVKRHSTEDQAFHRLKVRLKREIVTIGRPELGPTAAVGTYVAPQDWNALLEDPGTLVIDTRNAYEVAVGSFAGAIDPGTASFRDFPEWVERQLRPLVEARRPKALALFCTGGIRCEKATAHLIQEGFEGVHHLQGGILRYLETVDPAESRWRGECFVFDQRVAVNHRLEPGDHSLFGQHLDVTVRRDRHHRRPHEVGLGHGQLPADGGGGAIDRQAAPHVDGRLARQRLHERNHDAAAAAHDGGRVDDARWADVVDAPALEAERHPRDRRAANDHPQGGDEIDAGGPDVVAVGRLDHDTAAAPLHAER